MPMRANAPAIAKRLHYIVDNTKPGVLRKDAYIATYRGHLETFAAVTRAKAWTAEKVIECVAIVYTWIARRRNRYVVDVTVAQALAVALNDGTDERLLSRLARNLVNDSMMAGSKFLHFYDPERFPITDDRCQHVSGKPWDPSVALDCYIEWQGGVHSVDDEHAARAMDWARATFGYGVTRTRAIEAMAFYFVKALSKHDQKNLLKFFRDTYPADAKAA
ncbi:hypothetical protein [Paraburkholderia hospita]|nr:hypothetical protein [Paraburkholderia hospita]SEH41152.1 hypothetical protein SAMN05192544_1001307 [Paraburkholderia hospita]